MYTKKKLAHFVDWLEQKNEMKTETKEAVINSVLFGMTKQKELHGDLNTNNLRSENIIRLIRFKINQAEFDEEIGLCSAKDKLIIFSGVEQLRDRFEYECKKNNR